MNARKRWTVAAFAALAILGCTLGAASASAKLNVTAFDGRVDDRFGNPYTQAGGHPYEVSTVVEVESKPEPEAFNSPVPVENVKTIRAELPPGFVGDPRATPLCSSDDLFQPLFNPPTCNPATQVGIARVDHGFFGTKQSITVPVYNMTQADPENPAEFGFKVLSTVIKARAAVQIDNGYRVALEFPNVGQGLAMVGSELTLWGVPGDSGHDPYRGSCLAPDGTSLGVCETGPEPRPFISLPTSCTPEGVGLETKLFADSWETTGDFDEVSFFSHLAPYYPEPGAPGPQQGTTGCDGVPFGPTLEVQPRSTQAGAPTGLDVTLEVPQQESPNGTATAHVKDVSVTLPQGMTVSPASADGMVGCSSAQIGLASDAKASCPPASKLGSVTVETPVLEEPLEGSVYLAQQNANPFGSLLAMYVVAEGGGVTVKLAGKVTPDPQTGQLTASFVDNPQLPFESLQMRLRGGDRAPLVNPPTCGTYDVHAALTGWARPNQAVGSNSTVTINGNCGAASQFTPGLEAGVTNPVAGKYSPFTLRVTRPDGQQNLSSIETSLPKGLLAKLKGVALCGDAAAVSAECPGESQVGTTTVGAGAGSSPLYVPQSGRAPTALYLAGPYKGAPLSLIAKVPAQAGPFDLGTVVVRNALHIDPVTAQVTATSDPLPQILQGIPVTYRDVRVDLNREGFTLNPTSCDPMSFSGQASSASGAKAPLADRFQVAGCERLAFKPRLAMQFIGKTHRSSYPRLKATVTMPKGGANIGKTVVLMPKTELLENAHIRTICTRDQWASDTCPKGSIYGKAKAWTPLLDKPLQGNVYLRSNGGARELPDLVADLKGQIDIELVGYIDAVNARLRARFLNVPDAPVGKFMLDMQGGKKGLLVHNTDVCKTTPRASAKFDGLNGKTHNFNPVVKVGCGKKK